MTRGHEALKKVRESRLESLEELKDTLLNAIQNVAEGQKKKLEDGVGLSVEVWLLEMEAEFDRAFSGAMTPIKSAAVEATAEVTPGLVTKEGETHKDEVPAKAKLADRLYGAMSMFMPYDDA